ncbi:putrescine-binding periplasmic protein [Betaproteobacteria bacterium]|nr:putrescine-binding periplasmic protein [Betaproteobacteria bacterium]GHU12233.1 putrescine-binding periplasmic protein [Betaproteobacteria bacterium]GHU23468.1 putrescine-binding periplasmic protein [Betaproteobacteria bacterium]
MKLSFREITFLSILTVSLLAAELATAQEAGVLNVCNWEDYIAPDTIENFEKETGIKVNYETFESNEALHAKLVAGKLNYDVIVPGSHFAKGQIAVGLLQKLDKSKLPNLRNLDPAIQTQLGKIDPGNEYLVDWLWGHTTLGINVDKVRQVIGAAHPENVWDLVFKPKYASKLQACGVSILDSASEIMPIALHYLGKDPYSKEQADYVEAGKMLKAIRPYVTHFVESGSDYIDQLAEGKICVALGWSGDILGASNLAKENKTGQNIQVLMPPGGLLFFDVMAIPKNAKNVDNAHKWINYILRPEVHASLSNTVFYANPNKASLRFVRPEIVGNKAVFLPAEVLKSMLPPGAPNHMIQRTAVQTFADFKNSD